MKQAFLLVLALLLQLAAACGSVDAGAGPGGDDDGDRADAGPGDHTGDSDAGPDDPGDGPPAVLEVTPADGAGGVMPNAEITVVFSRPMDAASVEAAWSSAKLPAAAVSFAWSPAGDVLTVTPDDPLPVAEGSAEDAGDIEALAIAFSIAASARDAEGISLAEPLEVEFRTARRLSLEVPYHEPLSDCRYSDGTAVVGDLALFAGDDVDDQEIRMVVSFALPELPPGAVVAGAVFLAEQSGIFGEDPYPGLGDLRLAHIRFNTLATSFAAAALGPRSVLSSDGQVGSRSVPVTRAVADDYADDRTYAQFRAEFEIGSNNDGDGGIAVFPRADLALSLAYLTE
jgi:hypothetical protein